MNKNVNRRKASMLMYEIEEAFGEFVKGKMLDVDEIPESVLETFQERIGRTSNTGNTTIDQIIENTYLDEIFQLANIATNNTSLSRIMLEVKNLALLYQIYEIRNVIAHPNRQFTNCYWYRLAAFSSESVINILGLTTIQSCIESAESGKITDPPEEWLENVIFEIRNNLPVKFEHDITGLIGRAVETKRLLELLKNPRVNTVSVIAPGGFGKTALVLDLLHQLVKLPETSAFSDAIIFVSLKIENITIDGVNFLDASRTIEELKNEISLAAQQTYEVPFENFDECKEYLKDQNLIVCIDNLETLLRDDPGAFDTLNLEFPPLWRVVVTSRTTINSNQSIRLEPLGEKFAVQLVYSYLRKKGAQNLGANVVKRISRECYYNPLAIRLTLDRVIAGSSIPLAIDSSKSDIAEFSFRNLIEALSEHSNQILEALLVSGSCEKGYLCDVLDITLDEVSNSLMELFPTSLINRKIIDDVEMLELSSSVKDLLLLNSNNIDLRDKILDKKNALSQKSLEVDKKQKELSISKYHVTYIPDGTNQGLKIILEKYHRCSYKDSSKLALTLKEFRNVYESYKGIAIFQREYSRLLISLRDYRSAIEHSRIAVSIDGNDPLNHYVLADCYFRNKEFDNSFKIYQELYDHGYGEPKLTSKELATSIYHGLLQSLLNIGDYETILKLTDDWANDENFSALLGGYRSTAYKRCVENSHKTDPDKYIEYMTNAIDVMNDVFEKTGYFNSPCILSWKIFEEICYFSERFSANSQFDDYIMKGLTFLDKHLSNSLDRISLQKNTDNKLQKAKQFVAKLRELDIKDNPLKSEKWKKYIELDADNQTNNEITESYIKVTVYHFPKDSLFMFAKDEEGKQYYLNKDYASGYLYDDWSSVTIGTKLCVLPSDNLKEGKAIPAKDIQVY